MAPRRLARGGVAALDRVRHRPSLRLPARGDASREPKAGQLAQRVVVPRRRFSDPVLRRMDPLFCARAGDRAAEARVSLCPHAARSIPRLILSLRRRLAAQRSGGDPDGYFRRGALDSIDSIVSPERKALWEKQP